MKCNFWSHRSYYIRLSNVCGVHDANDLFRLIESFIAILTAHTQRYARPMDVIVCLFFICQMLSLMSECGLRHWIMTRPFYLTAIACRNFSIMPLHRTLQTYTHIHTVSGRSPGWMASERAPHTRCRSSWQSCGIKSNWPVAEPAMQCVSQSTVNRWLCVCQNVEVASANSQCARPEQPSPGVHLSTTHKHTHLPTVQ